MSAQTWVNDGGTPRQVREVWINDAGTPRRITEVWVNDNGVARRIYVNDVISLNDQIITGTFPFGSATVGYVLSSDGYVYQYFEGGTSQIEPWITPQTNVSSYECFVSLSSGDSPAGTLNAWQSLSSNREWTLTRAALAVAGCVLDVQVRRASDAVVLDTATITLSLARDPP